MILALAGSNVFALQQKLDQIVSGFVKQHGELAVEKIDCEVASENQILDAVQTLPFLAEKKMVVLKSLSLNKSAAGHLEQIISSAYDNIEVVFFEPGIDKRTSYFKVLKSKTEMQEMNELDVQSLARWLVEQAKESDAQLSPADANYLVERVGNSQQILVNELKKLATYEPKITRQNIDLLTEANPQSKVFELLDAMFAGNKKRALKLYDEQRVQKIEPQAIVGMIAWQLQIIALAQSARQRSVSQISRDSGASAYPIEKAKKLGSHLGTAKLKLMTNELLEIDYRSKTRAYDLNEALKNYIVTI